jgi:hypothetical protein
MTSAVRIIPGRTLIAGAALAVLAAACSSGGTASPPSPNPTPVLASPSPASTESSPPVSPSAPPSSAPSVAARSSAPATFVLTTAGDRNVTGTWSSSFGTTCDNPTFSGPDIIFFAASPDKKAVVLITLNQGSIGVSERAGSGASYTDREFQGTGVTSFDPATGAAFDSTLTIIPTPESKPGTLGTISHVTGSVDCAGQTAGTSTIVFSGASAEGAMTGPFSAFRATCVVDKVNGNAVSVTGIIPSGSTQTGMTLFLTAKGSTIFSHGPDGPPQHAYDIAPQGTVNLSVGGAHVDADFVERLAAGAAGPPHTLHVTGDVTCGSTTTR